MSKLISKIVVPDSSEATGYALYNVKDANAIPASEKGVASGVATLDSSGKVPSSQLPSYVDDVIEGYYHDNKFYATYTPGEEEQEGTYSDEITPEQGKIYVDIPTNQSYRWSGSTYIVISSPYVLPTASANTLGGVKVGDGLSIDNNGVLSAEGQEVEIGHTSPTEDVKLFIDEDADPAVSIDVYTRAQVDAKVADTVHLSAQTLTEAQKAQARDNIGVVGSGFQVTTNETTGTDVFTALGTATITHDDTTGADVFSF